LATNTLPDMGSTNVTSVEMVSDNLVKAGNPVVKPK
jgi:hypothetical protein